MSNAMLAERPAKVAEPVQEIKVIKPTAFSGSEFAFGRFSVVLPEDWTVEDVLKPEAWRDLAYKFRADPMSGSSDRSGSIIEVRTVHHAFYAELYVRAVQERSLVVALIRDPIYFGLKRVKSGGYKERWNLGKKGFDIIRLSDNVIVAHGDSIKTKEQAQAWIDEAMKVS